VSHTGNSRIGYEDVPDIISCRKSSHRQNYSKCSWRKYLHNFFIGWYL